MELENDGLTKDFVFPKNIQTERLISLIERHRLIPTAYNQLKSFTNTPSFITSKLHQLYEINTRKMLGLASEMARLFNILDTNQIPFIALKGPLFAKLCYGDYNLRQSRDIDLLIQPENLKKAELILKEAGYKRVSPDIDLTPKQFKVNQKGTHEYSFMHPASGNLIEVHWRLFTSPLQLPVRVEDLFNSAEEFKLNERKIKVLCPQHRLLYLLVHGSVHNWFRLFWLRDIGQMLKKNEVVPDQLFEDSAKYGVKRSIIQGLVLSKILLKSDIPDYILKECNQSSFIQKLVKSSTTAISSREERSTTSKIERLHKPFYLMHLRKGWKYKFNCIYKLRTNVTDWKTLKLPDSFFFLYTILRPFTWFYNAYLRRKI